MTREIWDKLLDEVRAAHANCPALGSFRSFPTDLTRQEVPQHHAPCGTFLAKERGLLSQNHAALRDAVIAAGPHAHWRETYKGTNIGSDFMNRFGCYSIIGAGGAFVSAHMWAWIVYMPKRLHYPFHHHPAEEMYFVLAGEAEFMREGEPNEVLREGDTSEHRSNQPHAMETHDHPVMCMVVWRNGFETPPVLT